MPCELIANGAEIPVIPPDARTVMWIERNIDMADVVAFGDVFPSKDRLNWSREVLTKFPPVRLGTVFYPPGASNFAVAYLLVPASDLITLITNPPTDAGSAGAVTLAMAIDTPQTVGVELQMFPVAAYPLSSKILSAIADGLTLLVLTDYRFFLWGGTAGDVSNSYQLTWKELIQQIPVSITTDEISTLYGFPGNSFNNLQEPVAPFLDAIAENIGQRCVVASYDNTTSLSLIAPTTGQFLLNNNVNNVVTTMAGDVSDVTSESQFNVPVLISVVFPEGFTFSDNPNNNDPFFDAIYGQTTVYVASGLKSHVETVNFTDLGLQGNPVGRPVIIHDTAHFVAATNETEIHNLALQIATDIYSWLQFRVSFDLPGVFPWEQDGMHTVTWTYTADKVQTSVRPIPLHQSRPDQMSHDLIEGETDDITGSTAKILHGRHTAYDLALTLETVNTGVIHNFGIIECTNALDAGDAPTGHLIPRVSISAPAAAAPAGSMQWDDLNECFYVYSLDNGEWVKIGGKCSNVTNIIFGQLITEIGGGLYTFNQVVPYPGHPCMWIPQGITGVTCCEVNATTGLITSNQIYCILFFDADSGKWFFGNSVSGFTGNPQICLSDGTTHTFTFSAGLLKSVS